MSQTLIPSVCIDAVFEGKSFDDACSAVSRAGIPAIEFWGWWDKDIDELQAAQIEDGLAISACCTKFISLVDPATRDAYLEGLKSSIWAANGMGVKTLISQVGDFRPGVPRADQHQSLVDGLRLAAPLLEAAGVTLVIEPLNELVDHQGYYLVRSDEAFEIIDEVGSSNIKVVFDIYHQQISEGHLIHNIVSNIEKIGHFHAAGNPGRNELQRGEINYQQVFAAIRETDFQGYVGLEYWPLDDDPVQALQEVAEWLK
ncbi:MAG: hydroxypyruvate isomerase [Verrucomicrobiales bacterium]|jgi:hydroxypyruvate isomerase